LALVFIAMRRIVLYIIATRAKQFERDDALDQDPATGRRSALP
jgi:hypothetical protein